jgi:3',5'-cyclic AMP phosphodiesterase CpdA
MTTAITIAHLTDVHLAPLRGFGPRYWNVKRGLGYANWMRKRRYAHLSAALDSIVADLLAQAPDHTAVGGDLCNIGLPQEHIAGLRWLEGLGPPSRVSVVPGNHDIYCSVGRDPGVGRWSAYMASDAQGASLAGSAEDFPFVRVIGSVALIGVNSAVPTPPAIAWGRVGEQQLARLGAALSRARDAGLFRLVMIHHPPLPGQASPVRGLKDAPALKQVLVEHGADLVVHGHNHTNMATWLQGPSGAIPVVGAPSASLGRRYKEEPLARYNLFRIEGAGPWAIELVGRGLAEPGGQAVEIERRILVPQPSA